MQASLLSRKEIALNAYEVIFELPKPIKFDPGQYVTVTLSNLKNDPAGNGRIFSLVNSPSEDKIIKILYRFRPTPYKKMMAALPLGSEVTISNPEGIFNPPKHPNQPIVFLAAGVGIAPFMSMLALSESRIAGRVEGINYPATLFYTNRTSQEAPYLDHLKRLYSATPQDLKLIFTQTPTSPKVRLNFNLITQSLHHSITHSLFFLAGTPEFVEDLEAQLLTNNVPPKNIHRESFDGY